MLQSVDDSVGRVLKKLDELQLAERTIEAGLDVAQIELDHLGARARAAVADIEADVHAAARRHGERGAAVAGRDGEGGGIQSAPAHGGRPADQPVRDDLPLLAADPYQHGATSVRSRLHGWGDGRGGGSRFGGGGI